MSETYKMKIAGLERELPVCPLNESVSIAGFIIFGDVELTVAAASELLKKLPEFDYIVTPEAKSIPLAYEMSRQSGKKYFVVRKKEKLYMQNPVSVSVKSITTATEQKLILDGADGEQIRGKKIVILDDVISTGKSLESVEELVNKFDVNIVAKAAVLAEGDAGGVTDTAKDSGDSNLSESVVGVKKLEGATEIDACGQTRMARTEDGTLYIWGAAGTDGRLGLAVNGWVDTPMPLELADVRTFSAGLTTSGAITESGEACLWGTVYSYVVLYDENGDPAALVVDGPLVSYGSTPVRLYDNAQALAFGDAFVLLLRSDGTILAWGSNDHGQMADGDWTKAELADGDDEDEKDVVITESDQFVFPAVIAVPAES